MPFEPGRSGNPAGGPVGSRHRQQLNGEFIAALLRDFRHGGPKAIERVRRTQPAAYLKVLALLVPREHKVEQTNPVSGLSDEALATMVEHLQERIARHANQGKLIEGQAAEITADDGTGSWLRQTPLCLGVTRHSPHVDAAAHPSERPIGPRERKPRKRKVPPPLGA